VGVPKEAFNTGLDALARALKNWAGSRSGKRKGKPVGFPRFKAKRKARPSVRFTTGAFRCEATQAVLPRIGRVKLHEPAARLADLVSPGTSRTPRSLKIRRQIEDKTAWRGGRVIVADRWFASSKTCSECGAVKTKLVLSERVWTCTSCGTVLDRDVNAAANLARLAASGADGNGRGADRKTPSGVQVAVKLGAPPACGGQPGTRQRGETGTVAGQPVTAA
jgi:transposase